MYSYIAAISAQRTPRRRRRASTTYPVCTPMDLTDGAGLLGSEVRGPDMANNRHSRRRGDTGVRDDGRSQKAGALGPASRWTTSRTFVALPSWRSARGSGAPKPGLAIEGPTKRQKHDAAHLTSGSGRREAKGKKRRCEEKTDTSKGASVRANGTGASSSTLRALPAWRSARVFLSPGSSVAIAIFGPDQEAAQTHQTAGIPNKYRGTNK